MISDVLGDDEYGEENGEDEEYYVGKGKVQEADYDFIWDGGYLNDDNYDEI